MTTTVELSGADCFRQARGLTIGLGGADRSSGVAGRVSAPPSAGPLRIGEQPRSGLPKYRAFELRRRHAQIAARHALDTHQL